MSKRKCPARLFGPHLFEPRYSLSESSVMPQQLVYFFDAVDVAEKYRAKTYHHDVCRYCGAIAERVTP